MSLYQMFSVHLLRTFLADEASSSAPLLHQLVLDYFVHVGRLLPLGLERIWRHDLLLGVDIQLQVGDQVFRAQRFTRLTLEMGILSERESCARASLGASSRIEHVVLHLHLLLIERGPRLAAILVQWRRVVLLAAHRGA